MNAGQFEPSREPSSEEIAEIVLGSRVVAVVGMKDESQPTAAAFYVPKAMQRAGIRVIPVNPTVTTALGESAKAALADVAEPIDVVQIFRRADQVPAVAAEVLALPQAHRPKVVWMQSGIRNEAAAHDLEAAGIRVVMDRCYMVEIERARS